MDAVSAMGEESTGRLLLRFSLPTIAMMVVNGLYNVVDRVFIGHGVGTIGIAAVTVTFPLSLVAIAAGGLIGAGASTLISIALGEKRMSDARAYLSQSFAVSIAISVVLVVAGYLVMNPALRLLGARSSLLASARDYFSIILIGFLFQIPTMGFGGSLRSQGRPRASVVSSFSGIAINALLAPLFIFVFHWGLAGAAWATVIAQAAVFAITLALTQERRSSLRIDPASLRPSFRAVMRMAVIGAPVAAQNLIQIAVFSVANKSVSAYGGNVGIAVVGIITSIYLLATFPVEGIGMGAQALWGYNWGAREFARVRSVTRHALIWSSVVSVACAAAIELFPRTFVLLFNANDPQLLALGARGLRIFFAGFSLFGLSWIAGQFFQSVGRPTRTLILLVGRSVALIAGMLALPHWLGLDGIMLAGSVSDLLPAMAGVIFLAYGVRPNAGKAKSERAQPELVADSGSARAMRTGLHRETSLPAAPGTPEEARRESS